MVDQTLVVELFSCECLRTSLIQHWFSEWLVAVKQQTIDWTNADSDLCCHMVWLGHNGLMAQQYLVPGHCQAWRRPSSLISLHTGAGVFWTQKDTIMSVDALALSVARLSANMILTNDWMRSMCFHLPFQWFSSYHCWWIKMYMFIKFNSKYKGLMVNIFFTEIWKRKYKIHNISPNIQHYQANGLAWQRM